MTQRKEKLQSIDAMTNRDDPRLFRGLPRTKTIKHDLDRHLLILDVITTTHKTELRKLEKKK